MHYVRENRGAPPPLPPLAEWSGWVLALGEPAVGRACRCDVTIDRSQNELESCRCCQPMALTIDNRRLPRDDFSSLPLQAGRLGGGKPNGCN
jgi:hypothetical protein